MGEHVRAGDLDIWTEQVGEGPDVLLIGGLGDTVESWQFQLDGLADRYHLTAFDNRGAGARRCPKGASRRPRWPTTPPRCCARWRSRAPT
jgi:3-oxoadipate enol-lactonase